MGELIVFQDQGYCGNAIYLRAILIFAMCDGVKNIEIIYWLVLIDVK